MLPFTKRAARNDESSELINTGDIEVVRPGKAFPAPGSDRPRVFARSMSDDEMTTLMPRKGVLAQTLGSRPPPSSHAPRSSRSKPVVMDEPTRQFVRPSQPPPPSLAPAGLPRANMRHLAKPAPRLEMSPASGAPSSIAPVAMSTTKSDSDPRIDPPATVITTRTRIISPRPTVSWAAALVAMGVFVGLVTAVIARGDADSLIDATASFVDPSGNHAAAGASSGAIVSLQTKFVAPAATLASLPDTALVVAKDDEPKAVALNDLPTASPQPQKPAPVAYAAPKPHYVWHPAPRAAAPAAAPHADKEAAAVAAAPAPTKATKAAAARHAADDETESASASAADALAKAQLEASLR